MREQVQEALAEADMTYNLSVKVRHPLDIIVFATGFDAVTGPLLGIDIHGSCTVKPPCVYCDWDVMKAAEGDNVDTPFDVDTVTGWGQVFDGATELTKILQTVESAATMDALAEEMGISKRTIYERFKDKDTLLLEVITYYKTICYEI